MTVFVENLVLPSVEEMSVDQLRGAACVWCAAALTAGDRGLDLGARQRGRVPYFAAWYPRACQPCAHTRLPEEARHRAL